MLLWYVEFAKLYCLQKGSAAGDCTFEWRKQMRTVTGYARKLTSPW